MHDSPTIGIHGHIRDAGCPNFCRHSLNNTLDGAPTKT